MNVIFFFLKLHLDIFFRDVSTVMLGGFDPFAGDIYIQFAFFVFALVCVAVKVTRLHVCVGIDGSLFCVDIICGGAHVCVV